MQTTARQHGDKATVKQVLRCYNEGWHIPNIASITGVKPQAVREILLAHDKDITDIED